MFKSLPLLISVLVPVIGAAIVCDEGGHLFEGECIHVFDKPVQSMTRACNICRQSNVQLYNPTSKKENEFVKSLVANASVAGFWIYPARLSDISNYTDWVDEDYGQCRYMDVANGGKWNLADCRNKEMGYICRVRGTPTDLECVEDTRFMLLHADETQGANYYKAKRKCKKHGGYLAEIYSIEKQQAALDLIKTSFSTSYFGGDIWIGATYRSSEEKWIWPQSGKPVNNTDWAEGEQLRATGGRYGENCAYMTGMITDRLYELNSGICKSGRVHSALCEIPNTFEDSDLVG